MHVLSLFSLSWKRQVLYENISLCFYQVLSRQSLVKTKSFLVATEYFYVATKLAKVKRFYVARENLMS